MRQMRDYGVYELPNGKAFIACPSVPPGDGGVLYTRAEWEACVNADHEWDPDGVITFQGQPTNWYLEDLIDTDETAD